MIEPNDNPPIDQPTDRPRKVPGTVPDDGGLGSDGIDQGVGRPGRLPLGTEMGNEPDEFRPERELPPPPA